MLNCARFLQATSSYFFHEFGMISPRMTKPVQGWGTALDGAEGEVAGYLESRGAKRSERGGTAFHRMPSQRVKHHAAS